ncbi:hypothetical protein ACQJBY_052305 [Aegilops geniculata]
MMARHCLTPNTGSFHFHSAALPPPGLLQRTEFVAASCVRERELRAAAPNHLCSPGCCALRLTAVLVWFAPGLAAPNLVRPSWPPCQVAASPPPASRPRLATGVPCPPAPARARPAPRHIRLRLRLAAGSPSTLSPVRVPRRPGRRCRLPRTNPGPALGRQPSAHAGSSPHAPASRCVGFLVTQPTTSPRPVAPASDSPHPHAPRLAASLQRPRRLGHRLRPLRPRLTAGSPCPSGRLRPRRLPASSAGSAPTRSPPPWSGRARPSGSCRARH